MVRKRRSRARRSPRFQRIRRVGRRVRHKGHMLGGKFGGVGIRPIGFRLAVAKIKDFVGFHLGDDGLDHPFEQIITGFIPQAHAGFMVPAGATELIAELADRAIFGGGSLAGGFNLFGGMGSFAGGGGKSGAFAGD